MIAINGRKRFSSKLLAIATAALVAVSGFSLAPTPAFADEAGQTPEAMSQESPQPAGDGLADEQSAPAGAHEVPAESSETPITEPEAPVSEARDTVEQPAEGPAAPQAAPPATPEPPVAAPTVKPLGAESPTVTPTAAPVFDPAISVFAADGVTALGESPVYEGDTIVVKGTGFDPTANVGGRGMPIPATLPQGSYVVFGSFADAWKPSESAPSSSRANNSQAWVLAESVLDQVPSNFQGTIRKQWAALADDGSFEATLTVAKAAKEDGNYGVYSYGAGGVDNADQELSALVNYGGERPAEPVTPEPQVTPAVGDFVWAFKSSWNFYVTAIAQGTTTVSHGATQGADGRAGFVQGPGGDYDPATGLGTIRYQGTVRYVSDQHGFDIAYKNPWVVFGDKGAVITAETSRTDTSGVSDMVRIVIAHLATEKPRVGKAGALSWSEVSGTFDSAIQPTGWEQYANVAIDPVDFSFGAVETKPVSPPSTTPGKVNQGNTPAPVIDPAGTAATPVAEQCLASAVNGASFGWSVKSSFADYVNGGIAKGSASVGWGAGSGSLNAADTVGRVVFGGEASFTGHGGLLNVSLTNPVVQLTSASNARLLLDVYATNVDGTVAVDQGGVYFASLGLGSAATSHTGGTIEWSGIPATLTSAGAAAFGGFYEAGTALDSVSVTLPLGGEIPCDVYADPASYGEGGALASTGSDALGAGLFAMLLLLLGAGVLTNRRLTRRRA